MLAINHNLILKMVFLLVVLGATVLGGMVSAEAATLKMTPSTGVYTTGAVFTVSVVVDSAGQPINASEGTLKFNPSELSVVSVSRSNSIFSIWVTEPTFSNSAGTITFSGGSPSGYTGSGGTVMSVTLRAATAGAPRLNYASGAVLANDGKGTNVLTGMSGGTFTIQAVTSTPVAERVIEYVAPANTPPAPLVVSNSHPDSARWYPAKTAGLSWRLPAGVTSVRTLLDDKTSTIPTRVYDAPIDTLTLIDLPEGVSYFHIQFKNDEGWGKVTHYRLAVDSQRPTAFEILPYATTTTPHQVLQIKAVDEISVVRRYLITINGDTPFEYIDKEDTNFVILPALSPGPQTVVIEAFDEAGNSIVSSISIVIKAFEAPQFIGVPSEINDQVIPVLRGITRPSSTVSVTITKLGTEPKTYSVTSDQEGNFSVIPEGTFGFGVYEITAVATDGFGAGSDVSVPVRFAVQQPGIIRIGTVIVSVLSVVASLIGLMALLLIGSWLLIVYVRRIRRRVIVEASEAVVILNREFDSLQEVLKQHEAMLMGSRKGGTLTKAEGQMVDALRSALIESRVRVEKEVADVTLVARGEEVIIKNKNTV